MPSRTPKQLHDGIDKPLIEIDGQRLIDRIFHAVSACCREVLISSNTPQLYHSFPAAVIPDLYPGRGALGGLYSCLRQASFPAAFIVAGVQLPAPGLLSRRLYRGRRHALHLGGGHPLPLVPTPGLRRLPAPEQRRPPAAGLRRLPAPEQRRPPAAARHLQKELPGGDKKAA
ncbi:MAG: hypothetical protein BZ151_13460 [Desulfobacca sp. 4484_104]|nr:MAG: hypothetical protein BZ151_13460 [Desulfobacca sp. 4484_104]